MVAALIPYVAAFVVGWIGHVSWSNDDEPETMPERLTGKTIWVVGALAGLALWLWKGRR